MKLVFSLVYLDEKREKNCLIESHFSRSRCYGRLKHLKINKTSEMRMRKEATFWNKGYSGMVQRNVPKFVFFCLKSPIKSSINHSMSYYLLCDYIIFMLFVFSIIFGRNPFDSRLTKRNIFIIFLEIINKITAMKIDQEAADITT